MAAPFLRRSCAPKTFASNRIAMRFVADGWPTKSAHGGKLPVGQLGEYPKNQSSSISYLCRSLRLARRALMIRVVFLFIWFLFVYAIADQDWR